MKSFSVKKKNPQNIFFQINKPSFERESSLLTVSGQGRLVQESRPLQGLPSSIPGPGALPRDDPRARGAWTLLEHGAYIWKR